MPLWSATVNYTINATTFLEANLGNASHRQAGCGLNGNGVNFCTAGFPVNPVANRLTNGLAGLPSLFPDANVVDSSYYQYEALNEVEPENFDGTRVLLPPAFQWGGRVAAEHSAEQRLSRVRRLLVGQRFRRQPDQGLRPPHPQDRLLPAESRQAAEPGQPVRHAQLRQRRQQPARLGFGFANAALGIFSSYAQASRFVEGQYIYTNDEAYIQDNWKVNNRLTLDYGMRFVHQQPQYETTGQASNFLPEEYARGAAPLLYVAGCANGVYPCTGTNRQAMNPVTGQFLGPNSTLAIGAIVPNTGDSTNGIFVAGPGHHQDRVQVAGARRCAALRHGLRPDRPADARAPRRRRPVLRPAERQLGLRAGPQPPDPSERHGPLRTAADARAAG